MTILLYGAYGFTGRLIAKAALSRGARPILAGRREAETTALGDELGLPFRVFSLEDEGAVRRGLDGVSVVLNAAGPYSATFEPMVEACFEVGAHYLDITGEIPIFERAFALDERARRAGILVVPGVGFDVVPTDCLAASVAAQVDDPVAVDLAFVTTGGPSRGTARTMLEGIGGSGGVGGGGSGKVGGGESGKVRRDGRIVDAPLGSVTREIPFSDRTRTGVAIPWGDVSTAWHSTGIGNVRVFTPVSPAAVRGLRVLRPLLRLGPARRAARAVVDRLVTGPDERELRCGRTRVWCEIRGRSGDRRSGELVTPNAYALTAESAAEAALRVRDGRVEGSGTKTPSLALGADFVLELPGVERVVAV